MELWADPLMPEGSRDGFFEPGLINARLKQEAARIVSIFAAVFRIGGMTGVHIELDFGGEVGRENRSTCWLS